jgi:hypothetical protein
MPAVKHRHRRRLFSSVNFKNALNQETKNEQHLYKRPSYHDDLGAAALGVQHRLQV